MDLLSRLLSLMPVTGSVDEQCHFAAPWRIELPASGSLEIRYHVLLRGSAEIDDGSGHPLQMHAGDIVLLPSGSAHVLHDGSGARSAQISGRHEAGLAIYTNSEADEPANLMCGRFLLPAMPQHLLRDHLPACLLVRSGKEARDRTQPPNTPAAASIAHSKAHSTASSTAPSTAGGHLARLVELMREEVKGRHPGSESVVNHLSGALFGLTLRFASENGEPPRGLLALSQRPRLQPALSAMFDQPGEPWSLPGLAALCNMSRATFARQFDEAIGRSPTDLLTEVRMAVAGRKLAQTRLPVPEIGEQVGYKSEAAFQRAFKKKVGVTPAQWRAQAKAQSAL